MVHIFYSKQDSYRNSWSAAHMEFTTYFYVHTDTCKTHLLLSPSLYLFVSLFMHRALDPQRVIQLACVRDYKLTSLTRERAT